MYMEVKMIFHHMEMRQQASGSTKDPTGRGRAGPIKWPRRDDCHSTPWIWKSGFYTLFGVVYALIVKFDMKTNHSFIFGDLWRVTFSFFYIEMTWALALQGISWNFWNPWGGGSTQARREVNKKKKILDGQFLVLPEKLGERLRPKKCVFPGNFEKINVAL